MTRSALGDRKSGGRRQEKEAYSFQPLTQDPKPKNTINQQPTTSNFFPKDPSHAQLILIQQPERHHPDSFAFLLLDGRTSPLRPGAALPLPLPVPLRRLRAHAGSIENLRRQRQSPRARRRL